MYNSSWYFGYDRPEVARLLPSQYYKVLEIGCGEGIFHTHLNKNCEYWGIEPFEAAANCASKILYKVLVGTYEEVFDRLPDRYFDLIICNDVIEHMADHNAFFLSIKHKMKEDSFIIGSIPNVRYFHNLTAMLIKKDWLYADEGILDRTHLRFFTEKSLKRTFIEHKFIIEEFYGIHGLRNRGTSVKNIIKKLIIYILGTDTKFRQFGFRIKYTTSPSINLE